MSARGSWRYPVLGVAFIGVLALVTVLAVAQYNRAFDTTVPVTVEADRSGLLMEQGAAVKLNGVQIGSVGAVTTHGDGARIALQLEPGLIDRVPADVSVHLVPTTVFGSKYVELRPGPAAGSEAHLAAGAVIPRAEVTVELNDTFDAAMRMLRAMPPSKLNSALTAVADSLRGNGNQAGAVIRDLDSYLAGFNPKLPELTQRLPQTAAVADDYREITDDLATAAANFGETSETLVQRQAELRTFLHSLTDLGNTTADFLARNGDGMVTTLDTMRPTTRLLARYSPVLPCFLRGIVHNTQLLQSVLDGPGGTNVTMSTMSAVPAYEYPQNLPKAGLDTGPDCHGLPVVQGIPPKVPYDTGTAAGPNGDQGAPPSPDTLARLLFGPLPPAGGGR